MLVRRSSRGGLATLVVGASVSASCLGAPPSGLPVSLRDPLGLIEDADELRLIVLPAETHACDTMTGVVAPMVPDVPLGMTAGAIVDIRLTVTAGRAMQEVSVAPGSYVALVRGKGTDPTTGVRDAIIATGCAEVLEVTPNETRGVAVTLNPVVNPGVCTDSVLSPDEQCTTPGVGDCDANCRTVPFQLNTSIVGGTQEAPRVAGHGGQRSIVTFVSERIDLGARVLGSDGRPLTMPDVLTRDLDVNEHLVNSGFPRLSGVVVGAAAAVAPNGRFAITATVVPRAMEFDVRVGFFSAGLTPEGEFSAATADIGRQDGIVGAFAADGSFLAAFVDGGNVAVRGFASGSRMPSGSAATVIGPGGARPSIAGLASSFVVAWERGGDVLVRRVGADGAPLGDPVVAFEGPGDQSQPSVAALPTGGFVVVFRDSDVDGNGSGIRGVLFGEDGIVVRSFQVNSTTVGDQRAPVVAVHDNRIAVAFESDSSVRARFLTLSGEGALNRERTPTTGDFEVASAASEPSLAAIGSGSSATWLFVFRTASDGFGDVFARRIPR